MWRCKIAKKKTQETHLVVHKMNTVDFYRVVE